MEKLLHERLRKAEGFGDICYYFDYDGDEEYEAYSKIADEIERYYIPIPTDENGKPWKCGDKCIGEYGEGTIQGYDDEGGVFVEFYVGDSVIEDGFYDTCNIERPTPKVLDADGVEIKVGDTVYDIHTCEKWICDNPCEPGVGFLGHDDEARKIQASPTCFTHREPDSLEKVQQFAKEWSYMDNVSNSSAGDFRDAMQEVADRLTAIMECE